MSCFSLRYHVMRQACLYHTQRPLHTSRRCDRRLKPLSVSPREPYSEKSLSEEMPVLFIQKYNRIIDVNHVLHPDQQRCKPRVPNAKNDDVPSLLEQDTSLEDETLAQRKIKYVLSLVSKSKTYEKLLDKLREKPDPLFSPAVKSQPSSSFNEALFVDEEIIGKKLSDNTGKVTKLAEDDNAELLKWTSTQVHLKNLPTYYLLLSKSRLTLLVSITAAAGYGLAPGTFDPTIFTLCTLGTGLISCSANAINQYLEVPFDSQMNRTKNRVLVRGLLSPLHAMTFAVVTGITGTLLLAVCVNGVAASLGAANLFLYTLVYTPMKRVSIVNTWIGSVVGAIPPLIGWTAATGSLDMGALVLGGILYAWQFPHFNSLSWNLRPDYSKAGYRMMSVTDPNLCRRVALRYSFGCIAICSVAPVLDVTNVAFALDSLPLNLYLTFLSWKFYQNADSASSRKLFRFTLIHLPLLMMLMFISKKEKKNNHDS